MAGGHNEDSSFYDFLIDDSQVRRVAIFPCKSGLSGGAAAVEKERVLEGRATNQAVRGKLRHDVLFAGIVCTGALSGAHSGALSLALSLASSLAAFLASSGILCAFSCWPSGCCCSPLLQSLFEMDRESDSVSPGLSYTVGTRLAPRSRCQNQLAQFR
ncbi:hypothetical protein G7046_g6603 [Stylonectria norvegica]|nr:hypothetical protein G7046_g6603 [Stylonectria norvegica]